MKKWLILFCLCAPAWATTTVSGNLKTLGGGSISLGTFIRFYLRGCAGNQPRINGTALIGPTLGNVFYADFVPNSSGAISGTIYSTTDATGVGNGDIECGGVKTGMWYGMVAFVNGKSGPETPIPAKTGVTIDISSITPLTANPVIVSPTGDQTYARLDGGNMPFTGAITAPTINNIKFVSQQTGADNGLRLNAAMAALPSTGGVVYNDECGAQTWSTNVFSGITTAKITIQFVCASTITINVAQSPNVTNIRIIGAGGFGGNGGGTGATNTVLSVGFATGDVFTPTASASAGEVAFLSILAGVTRTSGYVFDPAPGANAWKIHDLHIQNQYGTFKLFAGGGVGLNSWQLYNLSWNCGSSSLHTAEFLTTGSTDNTVTMSQFQAYGWQSTGDICIHDTAAIHLGSNTDSPNFSGINFSISRSNTSAQPNWLLDNTLGGGIAPRLVYIKNLYSEGDGVALNDIFKIAATTNFKCTDCDIGGGDHGYNITGGSGIGIIGGQVANHNNGGIYVTSAVSNLGLSIIGTDFYGNSVTTTNTTDDIQIADGTTNVNILGTHHGEIASTVTVNTTRYAINFLGTTSGRVSIHGTTFKSAAYGTAFIRDVTAYSGETEMDDGRTLVKRGTASGSARIIFLGATGQTCFQIGANENAANSFEITPSTAACAFGGGFPTFSRVGVLVGPSGTTTINGSSQPALALTNGANTGTLNLQDLTGGAFTVSGQPVVVMGSTSQKAETGSADTNVLTVTPTAVAGTYRACFSASVSAATSGVIGWTLSWTDSNGNGQTNIAQSLVQQGTAVPALTFTTSAISTYQSCSQIDVNNAATSIIVKWVGGGTTTAKVSATVERLI